jgi:hypothetical protein
MKTSPLGRNRTGIHTFPGDMQEMLAFSTTAPAPPGDESALATLREQFMVDAETLGSVPPPGTLKGMLKSGLKMITGNRPQILIDKIAERLAFERTSVRLYEALITKHAVKADELPQISAATLHSIHDNEVQHFALLVESLQALGADPTAQTPCADMVGVQSLGLLQVITDARTTFAQSLNAILVAELTDNESWDMLVELAELEGHEQLAERFRRALETEETHLDQVRGWLRDLVRNEAKVGAALS